MALAKALLVLLLLLLPAMAPAGEKEELLSFADALFAEGDHYRAITEYKRFLHLFAGDEETPRAALRIAECFMAGSRWEEAEEALLRVSRDYPDTEQADRAALLYAEVPYRRGDFATAAIRYRRLLGETTASAAREELRYRLAWTLIEQDRYDDARKELAQLEASPAGDLSGELEPMDRLPEKSPSLAGGLSALLPGAGQLYAGRPRDAALAFLLNGAFIWGAVESFDDGNEVVGSILLFFEAGWYTGNVFNAANSAHKYNRDRREAKKSRLRRRYGVTLALIGDTPRLGLRVQF
jgi:tetratricopeptide (TPR) repeat protein